MKYHFEPGMDVEFKNKDELQCTLNKHCYTWYHRREILKLSGSVFTIKSVIPGGYIILNELPNLPWKVRTTFIVPATANNNQNILPLFGSMTYEYQ